jgi:hypothetical protein
MEKRKLFIGEGGIIQIYIAKNRIRNQSTGKFTIGKYDAFYHIIIVDSS